MLRFSETKTRKKKKLTNLKCSHCRNIRSVTYYFPGQNDKKNTFLLNSIARKGKIKSKLKKIEGVGKHFGLGKNLSAAIFSKFDHQRETLESKLRQSSLECGVEVSQTLIWSNFGIVDIELNFFDM